MNTAPASLLLPHERARRRQRTLGALLLALVVLLALTLLDRTLWQALKVGNPGAIERKDWYQLLRQLGYVPTWLLIAAALWLHDRAPRRPLLLAVAAILGGAAAELIKLITQRLRPGETGEYVFRWVAADLPNAHLLKGLGLASSHAGVAFGAAFMLAHLFPRTAPLALAAAVGCALTRLLVGAHFVTDIYVAALASYAVTRVLAAFDPRSRPRLTQ